MKIRYELEYPVKSSPKVIFPRLSTPEGLEEWFADSVTAEGDLFSFSWEKSVTKAKLSAIKENRLVRFEWADREGEEDSNYFEFRINTDELTGDIAIVITDFAEPDEKEDSIYLWDTQVTELKRILGT
ncbi:MAG TPA: START-like domain-containing protein [Bacteroidales bacterium]|nr:START-like domain-containing protein [Bacteroidales bacterium]